MNDTLKAAGRIGAELGAAKAEVERLREVLSRIANLPMYQCSTENDYRLSAAKAMAVAALSQQSESEELDYSYHSHEFAKAQTEPTDTFTAVDMATAAAQGFRDGQAALVEAAQGALSEIQATLEDAYLNAYQECCGQAYLECCGSPLQAWSEADQKIMDRFAPHEKSLRHALAATIAQTAPQGKFRMGDRVKKTGGSEWVGHVCGTYSTALTPEGYAVESEAHAGSVQIYPAKALEAVE